MLEAFMPFVVYFNNTHMVCD